MFQVYWLNCLVYLCYNSSFDLLIFFNTTIKEDVASFILVPNPFFTFSDFTTKSIERLLVSLITYCALSFHPCTFKIRNHYLFALLCRFSFILLFRSFWLGFFAVMSFSRIRLLALRLNPFQPGLLSTEIAVELLQTEFRVNIKA